jgi:hypothetical protein
MRGRQKNSAILARVLHPERFTEQQFSWYAKYRFRYFSAPESTRYGCSSGAGKTLGNEGETRYSAVRFLHLPHNESAIKIARISVRCQQLQNSDLPCLAPRKIVRFLTTAHTLLNTLFL